MSQKTYVGWETGRLDGSPIRDHAENEICSEGASYLQDCWNMCTRETNELTPKFGSLVNQE